MSNSDILAEDDSKKDQILDNNDEFVPYLENGASGDSSTQDDNINLQNTYSDKEIDKRLNEESQNDIKVVESNLVDSNKTDFIPEEPKDNVQSAAFDKVSVSVTLENDIKEGIPLDAPDAASKASDSNNTEDKGDTFVDILGNGLLTKRILHRGLGRDSRPTHGESVTIKYTAWNCRDELFDEQEETFVLGDGDMIQAFDLALCLAEKGEEFELKTDSRFAYGTQGLLPDVGPNEAVRYQIKLLSVDDAPNYAGYSYDDRLVAVEKKKERGNYLYKREEYSHAVNSYSRAIKIIEADPDYRSSATDPNKADLFDLFVKVTNNLAASQLKLEVYESVIETCDSILGLDPSNVKALFRKGKSLSMRGRYEEAIGVLRRAFELEDGKNKLIATEIQKCTRLRRCEDEEQARLCRKMFPGATAAAAAIPERAGEAPQAGWGGRARRWAPWAGAVLVSGLSVLLAVAAFSRGKTV